MHPSLTVIGPIASGKTTASRLLSTRLGIPLIDADLYEVNPFLENYVKDPARWSFATELFFTIQRIKKLGNLRKMLRKSPVVVDSGLIMSHEVFTKNHLVQGTMTASEWDFFTAIVNDYRDHTPNPTIVIHLTASPRTQLRRIKSRGRAFEAGYTLEYLSAITDRLNEYAASQENMPEISSLSVNTEEHDLATKPGQDHLLRLVRPLLKR